MARRASASVNQPSATDGARSPRRTRLALAWLIAAIALSACSPANVSGSYVAVGEHDAALLQITQTPDQRLTGTLQGISLQPDGTLDRKVVNLTGAVDGESITVTLASNGLDALFGTRNASGKVTGDTVDLLMPAGGNAAPTHLVVKKQDAASFESAASNLAARGAALQSAHAQEAAKESEARAKQDKAAAVTKLATDLTGDIDSLLRYAQGGVAIDIRKAQAVYEQAVGQAQSLLAKEKQQYAGGTAISRGDANVTRGELSVTAAETKGTELQVIAAVQHARDAIANLSQRVPAVQAQCASEPDAAKACAALAAAADQLAKATPKLRQDLNALVQVASNGNGHLRSLVEQSNRP